MKLEDWLRDLSAKQPTPGGGAAAGLAASAAAALVSMVSNYTTGPKWQDRETEMHMVAEQAANLCQRGLDLMAADEEAFKAVGAAYALPKDTDEDKSARQTAIQEAVKAAAEPPKQVAIVATEVITLAANLVTAGNPNVISDVAVAASFARAAIEAAIVNIEINAVLLQDPTAKAELQSAVEACESALAQADAVVTAVRQRIAGA